MILTNGEFQASLIHEHQEHSMSVPSKNIIPHMRKYYINSFLHINLPF